MPWLPAPSGMMRVLALYVLLTAPTHSQTAADNAVGAAPAERVATEVLTPPVIKRIDPGSHYPTYEYEHGVEGWVLLGYMVDTKGSPFEITVVDSSGNPDFERAATKAMESAKLEAGMLNGQPVESASELKLVFTIVNGHASAGRAFVQTYDTLMAAIKANDRAGADAAMKGLTVSSLYEDAYFGLASYQYARAWGDEAQQLAALKRAIANDHSAHYLRSKEFQSALLEIMKLELKEHLYGAAQVSWHDLQASGIDPAVKAQIKPVFDRLDKLRSDDTAFDVTGSLADGTWHQTLLKKNFRAQVTNGHISDVKLRCARGFVRFAFDPAIQYHVETRYGSCTMEIEGDRGTQFVLTQF
ncbi:MAG TPA: energy transducer TonB [Steroidobacteraceae bacterium]|jgi:TonB family protein